MQGKCNLDLRFCLSDEEFSLDELVGEAFADRVDEARAMPSSFLGNWLIIWGETALRKPWPTLTVREDPCSTTSVRQKMAQAWDGLPLGVIDNRAGDKGAWTPAEEAGVQLLVWMPESPKCPG